MVFAVEEINNNSSLLPGVKLGYRILDSCDNVHTSLQALFSLVGHSKDMLSDIGARKEGVKTTEQKRQKIIVTTMKNRDTEISTTKTDMLENNRNDRWENVTAEKMYDAKSETSSCMADSPVPVVIGLASSSPTRAVAQTLGPFNIPLVSYFATCTCLTDKHMYPSFLRTVPNDLFQVRGLVQLVTFLSWLWVGTVGTPDDYSQYGIQAFSTQFKQQGGCLAFHLTIPKSPTAAEIQEFADTLQSSTTQLADRNVTGIQWVASEAWVTATLLTSPHFHPLLEGTLGFSFPGVRIPDLEEFLLNVHPSPKPGMELLLHHLQTVNFTNQFEEKVYFDSNGEPVPLYDIINWQKDSTGSTECTKCPEYYWSDKDKVKCVAGVEDFLSFNDTMGIILVALTLLGVVSTTIITTVFHQFRFTPIVKANNSEISFLLLVSLKLCFLCSLVFIGQPSVWTCRLRQAAFGISFVLCLSCLFVKTIVVLLAFRANLPGSRALKQFGPSQQRTLILCTTTPQIVLECKEPWPPGFYLVLGYIGLLAFLCLLLAYLGRKLPDTFNEAKLITFSMLIFWAVWISFIPAYVSSPGKFTVAVEGNCVSTAALDDCVFLGKEEKNSLYEDGDVVIGGLFPLHYSSVSSVPTYKAEPTPTMYKYFSSRALRWMQTMTFAITEINERSDLLPQLKLGFHIRDSSDDIPVSLRASLLLVNGQPERGSTAENVTGNKNLKQNLGANLGCSAVQRTVSSVIIGDAASGVSMALLRSLGSFHIPLVSYFASCSCLSNQREFPTFMRTMPSDAFQIKALARLVSYFGWTWVGVIGVESDYARFAIELFLQESVQYGVCAAYTHFYPVTLNQQALDELLDVIQMASSKVIINFSGESELQGILAAVQRRNITGLQWIASEAWATASSLWEKFGELLMGTLGFAIRRADVIPGLKQHLTSLRTPYIQKSAFLAEFWEELFNCRLNGSVNSHSHGGDNYLNRFPCKGTEDLSEVYSPYSDVTQLRVSFNVYKAVYLVAHALHDMSDCIVGQGPFPNGTCTDPKNFEPWQLIHYMKQANFSALGEKINFDQNGDPIAYYDLLNWQTRPDGSLRLVKVGFYDASMPAGRSLVINDSVIEWPVGKQASRSVCSDSCPPGFRIARRKGEPICCFDCVPCAEGEISNKTDSLECSHCSDDSWPNGARDLCLLKTIEFLSYHELMGIVMCVVAVLGACISLSILAIFFTYKDTPLVRANNMELSFLLLVFLTVCFLVSLLFIGEPSDWLCRIRYPAFGISFALCISCLLAKTVVVLMVFRSTLPGSNVMKWFGPNQQRASVLLGTIIQGIICFIWLLNNPPYANNNTNYHSATIIIECVAGSEFGFWCVLGYIGFLACMCFLTAFLARKLPDNFNEAKFITFSMLIFFAVWITFIPVYVSTAGKYTVSVHIFAILASAFALLFCIFVPKCYVIILKPDKNSKRNILLRSTCQYNQTPPALGSDKFSLQAATHAWQQYR
nr:extracellular calcium-sensing receptor-like [Labrus bergylta]